MAAMEGLFCIEDTFNAAADIGHSDEHAGRRTQRLFGACACEHVHALCMLGMSPDGSF